MKKTILLMFCAAAMPQLHAATMASQPWTTNRIAEAEARLGAQIGGKADTSNVYTRAETDAKIVELAPPADLTPATNYTDSAIGSFAATGTVKKARSAASADYASSAASANYANSAGASTWAYNLYDDVWNSWSVMQIMRSATNYTDAAIDAFTTRLVVIGDIKPLTSTYADAAQSAQFLQEEDNQYHPADLIRASTNAARAVVREMSLGGIWDQQLEVWWTPVMVNGALTYQATTNVNMEAAQ